MTTNGDNIPSSICIKCRDKTACTCNLVHLASAQNIWGMTALDWEEQRNLANEGIEDYVRILREIDAE